MERILIVEDEKPIREFMTIVLGREDFHVLQAVSGEEALAMLQDHEVDLMVLDIRLPGIDGFEVCRRVREDYPGIAIIMVTAKSQDLDKIMGLELGADDYIIKPFNVYELIARIRAVLRRIRQSQPEKSKVIIDGQIEISPASHTVHKDDQIIELTPREFDLLVTLAQHPGVVLNRDRLLDMVWEEDYFGDTKTVDVHIRRLREKIEDDPSDPVYIETVWGIGYKWRAR